MKIDIWWSSLSNPVYVHDTRGERHLARLTRSVSTLPLQYTINIAMKNNRPRRDSHRIW